MLNKQYGMPLKSLAVAVMALCLLLSMSLGASAAGSDVTVYVDGNKLAQSGLMLNGATLVPMRAIFEALGAEVKWDGATRTVTANKESTEIRLTLGQANAYVNGELKTLSTPAASIDGATMVPLRFIGEALGAEVKWEGASKTVRVNRKEGASTAQAIKIDELVVSPRRALRTDETLTVQMRGEKGCKAVFDIVGLKNGIPMHEDSEGVYSGSLTILKDMKISDAVLIGRLSKDGKEGSKEASSTVTINSRSASRRSGTSSQEKINDVIDSVHPADKAEVRALKNIKVNFINNIGKGSVRLFFDNKEVTGSCTYADKSISFTPTDKVAAGKHQAKVSGTDNEGKKIDYSWEFTTKNSSVAGTESHSITLTVPSENEKIGASLHLVGTTTPGATVKFEIVHKLSIIGGLGVKDVKRLEVIANSDGQFDTQVNMSDVTSGAAITVNGEVYVDGTKVASITRNAVRE